MRFLALIALFAFAVAACGSSPTDPNAVVTITPASVTVRAGAAVSMTQRPAIELVPGWTPSIGWVQMNTPSRARETVIIYNAPEVQQETKVLLQLHENDTRGAVRASATITILP